MYRKVTVGRVLLVLVLLVYGYQAASHVAGPPAKELNFGWGQGGEKMFWGGFGWALNGLMFPVAGWTDFPDTYSAAEDRATGGTSVYISRFDGWEIIHPNEREEEAIELWSPGPVPESLTVINDSAEYDPWFDARAINRSYQRWATLGAIAGSVVTVVWYGVIWQIVAGLWRITSGVPFKSAS